MSKRSTRIAKRDEFENALKEVEEKIRARREKNPEAVAPPETEERDGESGEVRAPRKQVARISAACPPFVIPRQRNRAKPATSKRRAATCLGFIPAHARSEIVWEGHSRCL